MSEFGVRIKVDEAIENFANAIASLTDGRVRKAEMRALNHTGDKAYTAVRKALIQQTSASRALIDQALKKKLASEAGGAGGGSMRYEIEGKGHAIPLRDFGARQFTKGTRAKVWGRLQTYAHTFIVPGLGGQVFKREGKSRLPIKVVYGPKLSSEVVKGESKAAFEKVAQELSARLAHEIDHLFAPKPK